MAQDEVTWQYPGVDDREGDSLGAPGALGPAMEAMSRQVHVLRNAYPDLARVSVDFLFYAFLTLYSRFGRFSYGPITIDTRVVEAMMERSYERVRPGEARAGSDESCTRFYRRLAAEMARSGSRTVDELHWLLAFMRTEEGLPARVFGELGVAPESVERYARGEQSAPRNRSGPERLYTPEEVAEYAGVHVQTVRIWIRSGRLPAHKLAGQRALRIKESDLAAILEPVDPATYLNEEERS